MSFIDIFKTNKNRQKVLLLIEPGGIGDYILIRPYLRFIKNSPKYKDYKIVFLSKDSYIDFIRGYDSEFFDQFISYNVCDLDHNKDYMKYLVNKINCLNVDTVINLRAITVPNNPDWGVRKKLIKKIKANNKIADVIKLKSDKRKERKLKIYTDIIYSNDELLFEFERRRLFFEKLLEITIPPQSIEISDITDIIDKNTVVMSLGSLSEYRSYPVDKSIQLINILIKKTGFKFVLLGSYDQFENYQNIISGVDDPERVINFAGKTNVAQLPAILKKCALLIGAESGTVHIANAVGCKTFCLSGGSYYGRYHPYRINSTVTYLYPEWFNRALEEKKLEMSDVYSADQPWSLADINVYEIVNKILYANL